MDRKVARPSVLIARIAEKQHGVVSIGQLRGCGISHDAVKARTALGQIHRVHRGVYALGHLALSPEGRWMAAVLALGGGPGGGGSVLDHWGATVSHRSALSLWNLLPANRAPCDVVVAGDGGRARRAGIRVHRSASLVPGDVTLHRGIPVTTPERTVADLREAASTGRSGAIAGHELRKAIRQASVFGLSIGAEDSTDRTRSDLERDFLRLCRRYGVPGPEVNVPIGPYLVDFLWIDKRLVVETDSYIYHRGKVAFQDDHRRDLALRRRGYEVIRLSEQQIDEEPGQVAETLAATLSGG
jgi:very-short-patch-repair endonuclease/predicted transcriptional regulator of viral defense system